MQTTFINSYFSIIITSEQINMGFRVHCLAENNLEKASCHKVLDPYVVLDIKKWTLIIQNVYYVENYISRFLSYPN